MTGGRRLTLQGGTLLHVASEYGNVEAAALLLDLGADVNARATIDDAGAGGHTAIFHAVTQFEDGGLPVAQLLLDRGADLSLRAKLPGDYDQPGEFVECAALGYALRFGGERQRKTVTLLRERGAVD
ncbi:MAG TPA: ankyrin repeat domain-containing protein [Bryobacteraceae bacterium]|nr:ankyrin repeat domain-containing protein [Bryobacteraceae bacterium]